MKKLFLIALLPIFLYSCSGMIAEIKELKALQQAISIKFRFKEVGVKLVSGDRIMVTLINTRYNDSTENAKKVLTDSVAIVCGGFFKTKHVTEGIVSFVNENKTGMVKTDDYKNYPMRISRQ